MARRGNSTPASPAPATAEVTPEVPQEDTVSTTTEAPEATTEQDVTEPVEVEETDTDEADTEGEDSTTEPAAQASGEPDLTEFQKAVDAAIESSDSATGDIAAQPMDEVTKAYRALDGQKAKTAARKVIDDSMKSAMNDMNIARARAFLSIQKTALTPGSGGGKKADKAPANPTEAFVQRVSGLRLALALASANVPDGVAEDWADQAKALVENKRDSADAFTAWLTNDAEDKGDAPEAEAWVQAAAKLSVGKSAKISGPKSSGGGGTSTPFTGERRDIGKHIAEAFEGKESGTFLSVSQIKNFKSTEYGDSSPSAGAISARLSAKKFTVEGVVPAQDSDGKKGARKL